MMKVECVYKHTSFCFSHKSAAGYCCRIKSISEIDQPGIKLIGDHEEGKSNRDVVGVAIQNIQSLSRFPRGFGKVFPNLRYLQIIRCSITTLEPADLYDLGNLHGLYLNENLITALPNGLFSRVQGLQHLILCKNRLQYIGGSLLTTLKNLKRVDFTDNACIDGNYNCENKLELEKLQAEIINKCAYPIATANGSHDANITAIIQTLTQRINRLEEENTQLKEKVGKLEDYCF